MCATVARLAIAGQSVLACRANRDVLACRHGRKLLPAVSMGEEFTITKYDRDTYAARMGIADDLGRGADPVCERIAMIDAAVAHLPSRIQENATLRAALNLFGGEVVGVKPRPAKQPAKEDEEQAPTEAAQAPATEATQTHEEPPSQTPQPELGR